MHFWKYQALGNDYIVMDGRVQTAPSADLVRRICDRHFGVGSDGILWHEEAGGGIVFKFDWHPADIAHDRFIMGDTAREATHRHQQQTGQNIFHERRGKSENL